MMHHLTFKMDGAVMWDIQHLGRTKIGVCKISQTRGFADMTETAIYNLKKVEFGWDVNTLIVITPAAEEEERYEFGENDTVAPWIAELMPRKTKMTPENITLAIHKAIDIIIARAMDVIGLNP